jgi:FtsP/CotA-like multicopper oxidase with cupredoxin domain
MSCRDIYLRIEKLPGYSPVAPENGEHGKYGRDCMRMHGHEDGRIPQAEIERRRVGAVVYREYLDPGYTAPNTARLVAQDVTEPRWDQRIPGCVLYAEPNERLHIHVRNGDTEPHTFHLHGLIYGIDSDGSWPFGVADAAGHRSDAICPGDEWCYVFDVTNETVGCWPFHDHLMDIQAAVDRGLFGGLVVRHPAGPKPDLEVPFFLHRLVGSGGEPVFDSGTLNGGDTFSHQFPVAGTFEYVCKFHPMLGTVRVNPTGPATANVSIVDSPTPRFVQDDIAIGVNGIVTWTHGGTMPHTVSDAATSPLDSMAINGRAFVGNTPIIVANSGARIRWYVFNLDLGERWHNFHPHGQRFQFAGETVDTRSIGPAESFCVDTIVPPVVLDPRQCKDDHEHHDHNHPHGHGGHPHPSDDSRPEDDRRDDSGSGRPKRYCLRGDFLVHCHVEMHMMSGMAALVRAVQTIALSERDLEQLCFVLPEASDDYCRLLGHDHEDEHGHGHGGGHGHGAGHGHGHSAGIGFGDTCPDVDPHPCVHGAGGEWELLPDLDIFVVHAALLHTGKVLLWSGTAEVGDPLASRLWDPVTDARTSQTYGEDLFCSGHAFLPDGRLCVAGGAPSGSMNSTHIFDPTTETWMKKSNMNQARWYPTVLTLPDGRILAASGSGASGVEVYDAATDSWQLVSGATRTFNELYPSLHQLPSGQIFYSRCGWQMADTVDTQTAQLVLTGPTSGSWSPLGQQQFDDRQEGTAVLQIDATVSPPASRLFVVGGGVSGAATHRNPQTVETIDLTSPGAGTAWDTPALTMNYARANVNAVLLPDGTVFIVGGQRAGKWNFTDPDPVLEAEIFDPSTGTFAVTPPMQFPRQYHSVAVLLPDGRVLCAGGVDPTNTVERDQRQMEVFSPPYLAMGARPQVTGAPAAAAYGATVTVTTPDAADIASVVLIRLNSVTHHTDAGHRWIKLAFAATATGVDVQLPVTAAIAPPGHYMLFLVNGSGVPSEAAFLRVG